MFARDLLKIQDSPVRVMRVFIVGKNRRFSSLLTIPAYILIYIFDWSNDLFAPGGTFFPLAFSFH